MSIAGKTGSGAFRDFGVTEGGLDDYPVTVVEDKVIVGFDVAKLDEALKG